MQSSRQPMSTGACVDLCQHSLSFWFHLLLRRQEEFNHGFMSSGRATGACCFLKKLPVCSAVMTRNPGSCCHHFQVEHITGLSLEVAGGIPRKLQFEAGGQSNGPCAFFQRNWPETQAWKCVSYVFRNLSPALLPDISTSCWWCW